MDSNVGNDETMTAGHTGQQQVRSATASHKVCAPAHQSRPRNFRRCAIVAAAILAVFAMACSADNSTTAQTIPPSTEPNDTATTTTAELGLPSPPSTTILQAEPSPTPPTTEAMTVATAPATTLPEERRDSAIPTIVLSDGDLLDQVIERGWLNCGVSTGRNVAFSEQRSDGHWLGIDADFCRAVAAAIFGDANAVEFVPLTPAERFVELQWGSVDVLIRNTAWTQNRDTGIELDFGPPIYYDGQQVMARASDGFSATSRIQDLSEAVVCTSAGTSTERVFAAAADEAGITVTLVTYETFDFVTQNFIDGACDAITADGSALIGRMVHQQGEQRWVIFPPVPLSREPLAPAYLHDQSRFGDVVNWTVFATIIADQYAITSQNIDSLLAIGALDPEALRLLGASNSYELQTYMGLAADAFYRVISQVGNYDEIYNRSFGPIGMTREGSLNALWIDGGLMYAPPAR